MNMDDPQEVHQVVQSLVAMMRHAEARTKDAEVRADQIAGCSARVLEIVEARLREAKDRIEKAEARAVEERQALKPAFIAPRLRHGQPRRAPPTWTKGSPASARHLPTTPLPG